MQSNNEQCRSTPGKGGAIASHNKHTCKPSQKPAPPIQVAHACWHVQPNCAQSPGKHAVSQAHTPEVALAKATAAADLGGDGGAGAPGALVAGLGLQGEQGGK
jgi:hypothetical protein